LRTSTRARAASAILVAGYLAMAVLAGAPDSPLTVLLPAGAAPPAWAARLAREAELDRLGRVGLTGVAWVLVLVVLGAFVVVAAEAWMGRVHLTTVLTASAASLAIAVAAPLLLSRDVYTYAAYGRMVSLYHRNPYVVPLSALPHDPFVAVASVQWLHGHSQYGPLFTLGSAALTRTWMGSIGATIVAFKALAGVAIAIATGLAALTAHRLRPARAPLAAALVGLNPVLVVHTVGGGHVDALIAAPLAGAAALAAARPRAHSWRGAAITALLTAACLIKVVIVPVLALWLWQIGRAGRRPALAAHLGVVAVLAAGTATPFAAGWHSLAPFATLGGVEAWASPSHLVGLGARSVAAAFGGSRAGIDAARIVEVVFLLAFLLLLRRLAQRAGPLIDAWGVALLLLALSMPYVLPWYAAWFAPFLGLLADETILFAGAFVTGVLALTLIPADPFHGLTTPAVMDGVHYAAAPTLLIVLAFVAARVARSGARGPTRSRPRLAAAAYAVQDGEAG
jgi:alpha-1,6-mannosyltransferase